MRGARLSWRRRAERRFQGTRRDFETFPRSLKAFLLYDSMGFPLDLTEQMALEAGLSVDITGFEAG